MFKNRKERKNVLIFIGLILLVLSILWVVGKKRDEHYFQKLPYTTRSYYEGQAGALGINPYEQDLVKRCYQSGQGPFDDGHLRCGVRVNRKVQVKPDDSYINDLLAKFVDKIKEQGFVVVGGVTKIGPNGASFSAGIYGDNSGQICTLHINYSPNSAYPDAKTSMDYELDCSKDASAVPAGYTYTR